MVLCACLFLWYRSMALLVEVVYACLYLSMSMYVCMYVHIYVCLCMYVCMHTVYLCMSMYVYVCMYTHRQHTDLKSAV